MRTRLIGRLPKVGVIPVIDGRGRYFCESYKDQKLDMATVATCLIENDHRFPSGEKVEHVISETTI